jgi:hypothetical protein
MVTIWLVVTPRKNEAGRSASSLMPFNFGGQATACPDGKRFGFMEGHAGDRLIRSIEVLLSPIGRLRHSALGYRGMGFRVPELRPTVRFIVDEQLELPVRDREFHDCESRHKQRLARAFSWEVTTD